MASIKTATRKDGSAVYYVLYRDPDYRRPDGKLKQSSKTFDDPHEAQLLVDFLNANGQSFRLAEEAVVAMRSTAPTLNALIDYWIRYESHGTTATKDQYRDTMDRHVTDSIGKMKLDVLKREHVVRWFEGLPVKAVTKKGIHGILSSALDFGVESPDWPIGQNPGKGIKSPDTNEVVEQVYLTAQQYQLMEDAVIDVVEEGHKRPKRKNLGVPVLVNTLVNSGMRFAEATALRAHMDVTERADGRAQITIARAWKVYRQHRYIGGPKSKAGIRTIILPMKSSQILLGYQQTVDPGELLFQRVTGGPLFSATFYDAYWSPARELAQERGLHVRPRVHDLRHTHASWLIAKGADPKALQARLGHKSIQMTYDRYGHLYDDAALKLASLLEA
ncbi:site-specific integrase [Nesterenkonia rhizosphaerae]